MVLGLRAAAFKSLLRLCLWQLIANIGVRRPNLREEILVPDLIEDQLRFVRYLLSLGVFCLKNNGFAAIGAAYLENLWVIVINALDDVLASGQRFAFHDKRMRDICLNDT